MAEIKKVRVTYSFAEDAPDERDWQLRGNSILIVPNTTRLSIRRQGILSSVYSFVNNSVKNNLKAANEQLIGL